jgi:LPXTG-site transpeptidase (sortase) family protein
MKKITMTFLAAFLVCAYAVTDVSAADYRFYAKDTDDFYRSTLYEDIYGSEYNYGSPNVTDFADTTALLPGILSPAPISPGVLSAGTGYISDNSISYDYDYSHAYAGTTGYVSEMPYTPVSGLVRADGSIGTLSVPSLSISVKVYEGTTDESLAKGAGHFPESSSWLGNICIAGHNRGSKHNIGSIKDLKPGDIITYDTVLGTKRYAVTFSGIVASTDISYLAATRNNRITLITCLSDKPAYRVCVQATEI